MSNETESPTSNPEAVDVRCPYCIEPAAGLGWSEEELRRGHRWERGAKVYHCYGAYCE